MKSEPGSTPKPDPTTLFEFFFEGGKLSEDAKNKLDGTEGMKKLKTGMRLLTPDSLWNVADKDVDKAMNAMLEHPIDRIIVGAWNARKEFRELAEKSRKQPGTVLSWRSGKQKIQTDHHPQLELTLDGFSLPAIQFTVSLVLAFQAIEVQVLRAKVTAIEAGTIVGEGTLKVGEVPIFNRKTREFRLPGEFSLREGFPID